MRRTGYYEFKDVPVKGRVYRYWYLRFLEGMVKRSVYLGKTKPPISAGAAVDAFRESRSRLPKPPAPAIFGAAAPTATARRRPKKPTRTR